MSFLLLRITLPFLRIDKLLLVYTTLMFISNISRSIYYICLSISSKYFSGIICLSLYSCFSSSASSATFSRRRWDYLYSYSFAAETHSPVIFKRFEISRNKSPSSFIFSYILIFIHKIIYIKINSITSLI